MKMKPFGIAIALPLLAVACNVFSYDQQNTETYQSVLSDFSVGQMQEVGIGIPLPCPGGPKLMEDSNATACHSPASNNTCGLNAAGDDCATDEANLEKCDAVASFKSPGAGDPVDPDYKFVISVRSCQSRKYDICKKVEEIDTNGNTVILCKSISAEKPCGGTFNKRKRSC